MKFWLYGIVTFSTIISVSSIPALQSFLDLQKLLRNLMATQATGATLDSVLKRIFSYAEIYNVYVGLDEFLHAPVTQKLFVLMKIEPAGKMRKKKKKSSMIVKIEDNDEKDLPVYDSMDILSIRATVLEALTPVEQENLEKAIQRLMEIQEMQILHHWLNHKFIT